MKDKSRIRILALAVVKNPDGRFLFHRGHDSVKKEYFYRALGGGVDFLEKGEDAIAREFYEELEARVTVESQVGVFEKIFIYEGKPGHEIVLVYKVKFNDPKFYAKETMDIIEGDGVVGQAVWRSLDAISSEKAPLYPPGFSDLMT